MTIVTEGVYTSYTLKTDPVKNPLDKLPPILKKNLRRNLCTCNEVLKIDIINAIVDGATSVEEIKKQSGVITASTAHHLPGGVFMNMDLSAGEEKYQFTFGMVDPGAFETLEISDKISLGLIIKVLLCHVPLDTA